MSDEAKFGILLSLEDSDFESDLKVAAAITKNFARQMKEDTSIKMDFTGEDVASMIISLRIRLAEIKEELKETNDQGTMDKLNKEAGELNDTIEFLVNNLDRLTSESEKAGKKMEISLKGSIKQAAKLALGLVGIRSIWGAISKASHTYMDENKVINQQLKITFNILSQAIGPVIKTLVNVVEYAAIILAKIIYSLTGFNVLAKAQAATLKNLAKEAKKAHNALASFDTISNMADNSDAMENYTAALTAYNDFLDKMEKIDKIWKDWGPLIEGIAVSMAVLWGVKTMSGLATLIGVSGTATAAGSGLMGVLSVLSLIAGVSLTGFAIKGAVELGTKDTDLESDLKWLDGYLNGNGALGKYYKGFYDLFADADERFKNLQDKIKKNDEIIQQYKTMVQTQDLSVDELYALDRAAEDIIDLTREYKNIMEAAGQDTTEIETTLNSQYELYDIIDQKLLETDEDLQNINEQLENANNGLDEFNDTELEDKSMTVNVDGDTSKLENKTNNWWTTFKNAISGWFSRLQLTSFSSLFPHFDVGTNYVPNDTLAMVHKGEMIVPKKYNPMTSGIGGMNEETNALLRQLNDTLENKQFNGYISASEITNTAINGINRKSREMGRSVVR